MSAFLKVDKRTLWSLIKTWPYLLVLLCLPLLASAQQYNIRAYSVEHGLGRSGVYDICEDSIGRLWFGTEGGGLSCFEGNEFSNFTTEDGLCDNTVRAVLADREQGIWVATQHRGVSYFNGREFTNYSTAEGLCSDHIRALVQDRKGVVWAGSFGQGICTVGDESRNFTTADGLASDTVRCAAIDNEGRIWFGTDGGISIFDGKQFENITEEDGLPDNKVLCIFLAEEGTWFGTPEGGGLLSSETLVFLNEKNGLSHSRVRSIWKDHHGYVWFGTRKGVDRFHHEDALSGTPQIVHYSSSNGLSNERIRDIYQDHSGSVWFATYFGGVCQYMDEALMHFTTADGLGSDVVTALDIGPEGNRWFGTFGGGVTMYDGKAVQTWRQKDGLPDEHVHAVLDLGEGRTVIGTATGLALIEDRKVHSPTCSSGPCGATVRSLVADSTGVVWIGTSKGPAVLNWKGESISLEFPHVVGPGPGSDIRDIIQSNDGPMMLATGKGLIEARLLNDTIYTRSFEEIDELLTEPMVSIAQDALGHYWIGTNNRGLLRYKEEVRKIDTDNGLSSNEVNMVLLDRWNNIWVGTRMGLDLLELDPSQEYILDMHQYHTRSGFRGVEINQNAALTEANGNLWLGTNKGVTRYSPDLRIRNEAETKTRITGIDLDFRPLEEKVEQLEIDPWSGLPKELTLRHDQDQLTFHFIGNSPIWANQVRYQFRLLGLEEEEWSPITDVQEITYSNIPPGTYTFEVQARSAFGVWNEHPTQFQFTIVPPLWQEPWFISLMVLLLIALIYGIVKWRVRKLKKEKAALESAVKERTKDLEQEKRRSDRLLLNILPEETAEELKEKGSAQSIKYDSCTVLFTDFKGFTSTADQYSPEELVQELDECFRAFDRICASLGVEKIKTIGDAYMCACGLPHAYPEHATRAALAALQMVAFMEDYNQRKAEMGKPQWPVRIGLHSGPLVAGVVGEKKFAYDIWGDTVNLASRMESNGEPGRVNISGVTKRLLKGRFVTEERGLIEAKNKGKVEMHFMDRLTPGYSADEHGLTANEKLLEELGLETTQLVEVEA